MVNIRNQSAKIALFCLALVPFFGFAGVNNATELVGQIYMILGTGIFALFVLKKKAIPEDKFAILFLLYSIDTFVVTAHYVEVSSGLLCSIVAYAFLFALFVMDFDSVLRAIAILGYIVIVINFITIAISSRLDNSIYFIGGKNRLSIVLIPLLMIILLNEVKEYGKIRQRAKLAWLLGIVSIVLASSGTGIVGVAFAIVFAIMFWDLKPNKYIIIGILLILYGLLILSSNTILGNQIWINFTSVLGKRSDLTNRTLVWGNLLRMMHSHWIFGLGREAVNNFQNNWGMMTIATEAHNAVLELFLDGGIIGFVLYAAAFVTAVKKIDIKTIEGRIIFFAITLIMINGLTESVTKIFTTTLILAIANYYNYNRADEKK